DGRRLLVDLLASLPRRYPMTVLHVTHHDEEAAAADRVVYLRAGRVVQPEAAETLGQPDTVDSLVGPDTAGPLVEPVAAGPGRRRPRPGPRLVAAGVGHTYAVATPWAQRALVDVDLTIDEGEGVLVVGGNGSGKSTLAWVLTGLLRPSAGACLLEGRPVDAQVGRVALAFQHARLQIQRPTVSADIKAAGGVSAEDAAAALCSVGLDPAELAERPVDRLSGGQLRRVALAGLLARKPRVLILDEPLAGLDTPTRASLLVLLGQLRRHEGLTLIVISHDLHGMAEVCDRTLFLEGGRLVGGVRPDGVLAAAGDGRVAP
ncbi:MAG: ATP-binding cassette domain-containing protein, partial [Acidimicrobiales bacterium]